MLDKLFLLMQKDEALTAVKDIIINLEDIVEKFTDSYLKDKDTKNAAIDAVIAILETHKDSERK